MPAPARAAELPFTSDERAEASAMLRDGLSTAHICGWFGCDAEQLARECPNFFSPVDHSGRGLEERLRAALSGGPATNFELQIATGEHAGVVARAMNSLMSAGVASNLAERRGRGSRALYALTSNGRAGEAVGNRKSVQARQAR